MNINDRVIVTIRDHINEVDKFYPGTIVDIETCPEYDIEQLRRNGMYASSDEIKMVKTGRYGIQLDNNPLIVDKPYFWPKDFRGEK